MDFVDISYHKDFGMDMTQVVIKFQTIHVPVASSYIAKVPSNEYIAHDVANQVSKMVGEQIYEKIIQHLEATASEKPKAKEIPSKFEYFTDNMSSGNPAAKITWDEVSEFKSKLFPDGSYTTSTTSTSGTLGGSSIINQLRKVFGSALDEIVNCPACEDDYELRLVDMVPHLNDSPHNWLRENIADWIETLDIDINAKEVDND